MLDLDATDDPLHGHQDGRFFHGYYDTHCYLPLYIFSGRVLLAAKLRTTRHGGADGALAEVERIVRQVRALSLRVRIVWRRQSRSSGCLSRNDFAMLEFTTGRKWDDTAL